jgi:hypothetical protein
LNIKVILPEVLGVLFAILILNLWYVSALTIEHRVVPSTYDYFLNATIVLSAAFFGSFTAFSFNNRKEEAKEKKQKIYALNSTLFVTLQEINGLLQIKRDIEPLKNDPIGFLKIPAFYAPDYSALKLELNRLEFLLQEHSDLLFELSIQQGCFESAVISIKMRGDFHHLELQKALNDSNFDVEYPTREELINACGPRIVYTAMKQTENMFSQVYSTVESLIALHERLHEIAKKLYPGIPFVKYLPNV